MDIHDALGTQQFAVKACDAMLAEANGRPHDRFFEVSQAGLQFYRLHVDNVCWAYDVAYTASSTFIDVDILDQTELYVSSQKTIAERSGKIISLVKERSRLTLLLEENSMFRRFFRIVTLALASSLMLPQDVSAAQQSVEAFFKGKDIRIIVPADMGGSFGLYGQLVARHLGKHLPGNPTLITQSMPGSGGIGALNYTFNVAPKDGTVLTLPHTSIVFETILNPDVKFDAAKFEYIGRIASSGLVGFVHPRTGIKTPEDAKTKEFVFGATGVSNTLAMAPMMYNRFTGAKIKIITGYPGAAHIFQAMERGEVDGAATTVVNPEYIGFIKKFKAGEADALIPIFTTLHSRASELPDVPTLGELGGSEKDRRFYDVAFADGLIGRSLAFPPGVPAEYVDAFRKGFDAMMRDPEFLAATEGRGIPLNPLSGHELSKLISNVVTSMTPEKRVEVAATYKEVLLAIEKR